MNRRTIMIDNELETKIRDIQAQLILSTNSSWSFSTVTNLLALAGIVSLDKLSKDDLNLLKSFVSGQNIGIKKKNVRKLLSYMKS